MKKPFFKRTSTWVVIGVLFAPGLIANGYFAYREAMKSPEQKALEQAQRDAELEAPVRLYSCREYIKSQMNNPASYDEVRYLHSEKDRSVTIVFRGTNGFGAVVQGSETCRF